MTNERSSLLAPAPTSWRLLALLGAAAALVVAAFVTSFAGAATHVAPRDLPLAVTGGERAGAAVAAQLDGRMPGAFSLTPTADRSSAERLIRDREVYGALVVDGSSVGTVLVASAASPAVSSLLTGLAEQVGATEVVDLVPAPAADPRGAGLAAGALPLTIGGVATGTLMALLVRGRGRQVIGTLGASVAIGAVVIALLHGWLGALEGSVTAEVGAVSLCTAAIAFVLVGLNATLGRAGLVVADLALILIGNPFSGATSAPELLPGGWSQVGHLMPLGSAVDALRGISGFDGAGSTTPLVVLAAWATAGLALLAVSRRATSPAAAPHLAPEVSVDAA